ncbi:MAG: adenosylcobinamide-phosphate synthase CbiB [Bacillota bacterium]|nr:adenosylcobinamide-phosphate synthase CbiB [Bacillota bacterium]
MPLLAAFALDWLLGDPRWLPHPVVMIGRLITRLETWLYKQTSSENALLLRGACLTAVVVAATYLAALLTIRAVAVIHPAAGHAASVLLLATTLAVRSLTEAARDVARPLLQGDLPAARRAVSMIVGRDTAGMDSHNAARAAVETVAENTVDGVTAPLFYALIGGAPLALAYKAVNTLDSMIGYRNERYNHFGRAAARLDDAANWLPARLTVPVMLLASFILRFNLANAFSALRRDGQKHPSPNSGLAEALTAGALGVTLGGENSYGGQKSLRPQLFAEGRPAGAQDIQNAALLMRTTAVLFLLLALCFRAAVMIILGKAGYV